MRRKKGGALGDTDSFYRDSAIEHLAIKWKKLGETILGFSQSLSSLGRKSESGLSYLFLVVFLATDLLVADRFAAFLAGFLAVDFFVPVLLLAVVFFLETGIRIPPFLSAMAVHVKIM